MRTQEDSAFPRVRRVQGSIVLVSLLALLE